MITTASIFRKYNFLLLNKILDKDEGVIYANSFLNPNTPVFQKPYIKQTQKEKKWN